MSTARSSFYQWRKPARPIRTSRALSNTELALCYLFAGWPGVIAIGEAVLIILWLAKCN